jgi:hypothetical protein
MKLVLIKVPWQSNNLNTKIKDYGSELLTLGETYEGELTPTIYDPQTLQPASPSYVVKCNDDNFRKVDAKYFITLEELREKKLNELGI